MENDSLDELLRVVAKTPLPPSPSGLESRVWREIRSRRSRRAAGAHGLWMGLASLWGQLRLAYAAVAVALIVGVFMGHQVAWVNPDVFTRASHSQTGDLLGLRVFSAEPPAMPSTLLAQRP